MLVCAGVCVCEREREYSVCVCALRMVSTDKILCFMNNYSYLLVFFLFFFVVNFGIRAQS